MKTTAEILGGAQALVDINFDLQNCFEKKLTNEHKTFLHLLWAAETDHVPRLTIGSRICFLGTGHSRPAPRMTHG